jgi:hypothetical protein
MTFKQNHNSSAVVPKLLFLTNSQPMSLITSMKITSLPFTTGHHHFSLNYTLCTTLSINISSTSPLHQLTSTSHSFIYPLLLVVQASTTLHTLPFLHLSSPLIHSIWLASFGYNIYHSASQHTFLSSTQLPLPLTTTLKKWQYMPLNKSCTPQSSLPSSLQLHPQQSLGFSHNFSFGAVGLSILWVILWRQ